MNTMRLGVGPQGPRPLAVGPLAPQQRTSPASLARLSLLAVPGMQRRGFVGVALHLQDELLAAAGIEEDRQERRIDLGGFAADRDAFELMFTVGAALDDDGARLRLAEIHERDRG